MEDKYKETTGESAIITHHKTSPKTIKDRRAKYFRILFCNDFNIILNKQWKFKNKVKYFPLLLPIVEDIDNGDFYISSLYVESSERYKGIVAKFKENA